MSLAEDNLRIATLKAIVDAASDEMAKLRAAHTTQLIQRYDEEGTSSFKVKLPDGTVVASINLKVPKKAHAVTDEERFMAWVEANHPDAIETKVIAAVPEQTIPAVPEQTLKSVSGRRMAELEKHFDLTDQGVVDTTTGTIVDGMVVVPAAAPKSFEVRYETGGAGGRTDLALAYRAGKLNHVVAGTATLPAIEAKPVVERRLASVPMDYDGSHGRLNGPGEPFTVVGETVANVEDDLGQCGMPGCVGCAGCDPDGDYSRFEGDGDQEWRANPTPVQDQVDADLAQEFGGHRRGEWDDARAKAVVEAFGTDPVPADDFDPGDWDAAPSQTAQGW